MGSGPFGEGKDVTLRAVVIGGGIGGIAAAVALARAGIGAPAVATASYPSIAIAAREYLARIRSPALY